MKFSSLGNTDLQVSRICLGTMTWGEQNTEEDAHAQLDYAFEQGINFVDTAEMYPVPPRAETQGLTDKYIGSWMKERGNRDKVILASKVTGRAEWGAHIRAPETRLSPEHINIAIDEALTRLQTDYIDLYQLHWPDRKTNFFGELGYTHHPDDDDIPLEETLGALDDLVKAGKIRHVGLSNETPWGTMHALELHKIKNLPRVMTVQNPYNLLNRTYEVGMAEVSIREQCGLLAYSPLAFGALSGKYLNGQRPEGARLTLFDRFQRYLNDEGERATTRYVALAKQHGLDPSQMALAYVNSRPFLTANIIGATSIAQLKDNIASIDIALSDEVIESIETIHNDFPNPCP